MKDDRIKSKYRVHILNQIKRYGWRRTYMGNPEPLDPQMIYNNLDGHELKVFLRASENNEQMICIGTLLGVMYDDEQKLLSKQKDTNLL